MDNKFTISRRKEEVVLLLLSCSGTFFRESQSLQVGLRVLSNRGDLTDSGNDLDYDL